MSRQVIRLACCVAEPVTALAHIVGDFAYHRLPVADDSEQWKLWGVTHVQTGIAIGVAVDKAKNAKIIVRRVIDTLNGRGLVTWHDDGQIVPGEGWQEVETMLNTEYRPARVRSKFPDYEPQWRTT